LYPRCRPGGASLPVTAMKPTPELRNLADAPPLPCVTLYLNTWTKEPAAREQARQFVERRIARARRFAEDPRLAEDLDRVAVALRRGGLPENGGPMPRLRRARPRA